jgi:hypothetical protein
MAIGESPVGGTSQSKTTAWAGRRAAWEGVPAVDARAWFDKPGSAATTAHCPMRTGLADLSPAFADPREPGFAVLTDTFGLGRPLGVGIRVGRNEVVPHR